MELRHYQREAADAASAALRAGHHPVLTLATGTGKSLIIAEVARRARRELANVWVLTHIQQLVEQNSATYARYAQTEDYGLVCAGLGERRWAPVTFGTLQSVRGPVARGEVPAAPDLIIIDEAHRVPHRSGEPSMYDSLLSAYPQARRLALTATPWRMDNGLIYGAGAEYWFDLEAYRYTVPQAVADGWLSPLVGVETEVQLDLEGVTVADDYVQREVGERQTADWLRAVAGSVAQLARNRRHVAVYCPTLTAAARAANALKAATGWSVELLTGGMPQAERTATLRRFRQRETRILCSVDTITTGFDLPSLDCIVCLRPTQSSSLWVQIQGRGTRLSPDKRNCLVLDYVGNLQRLGGVDMYDSYVREQGGQVAETLQATPAEPRERRPRRQLPGLNTLRPIDPMTGREAGEGTAVRAAVSAMSAVVINPRSGGAPLIMVSYTAATPENARVQAAAFLNPARPNAATQEWFRARRLAVRLPADAQSLLWTVRRADPPASITVRRRGRYWNVEGEHFVD